MTVFRKSKKRHLSEMEKKVGKKRFRTLFGEAAGPKTWTSLIHVPSLNKTSVAALICSGLAYWQEMPSLNVGGPLAFVFGHAVLGRLIDRGIRNMAFDGKCLDTQPDPEDIEFTQDEYGESAKKARRVILPTLSALALVPASTVFFMSDGQEEYNALQLLLIAHGLVMTLSTHTILSNLQKVLDEKWALTDEVGYPLDMEAVPADVEQDGLCLT